MSGKGRAWGRYSKERPAPTAELARYVPARDAIVTEHGEVVDAGYSEDIAAWLQSGKRVLLVSDLSMWSPLDWFLRQHVGTVAHDEVTQKPVSLRVEGEHRRASWVIGSERTWRLPNDQATLDKIRSLWDTIGVGDIPFPGALGNAAMRSHYTGPLMWNLAEYQRDLFRRQMFGGRSITPQRSIGQRHATAYLYDENAAFLHILRRVPAGKPIRHRGERPPEWGGAPSYHHISWEATGETGYGCLPVRQEDGTVIYPTTGAYDGWYWDCEIADAQKHGVTVTEWRESLLFTGWERGFDGYVEWAMALKRETRETPIAGLVKTVLLAGIGYLASPEIGAELTIGGEGEIIAHPTRGLLDPYTVVQVKRDRAGRLPHLVSYIFAYSRVDILQVSRAAGQQLIAADYDAVVTDGLLKLLTIGDKDGEWKHKLLKEYVCVAPRSAIAEGFARLPGRGGEVRQEMLDWYEREVQGATATA